MSEFEFKYTCPEIDRAIDGASSDIERHIEQMIEHLRPDLDRSSVASARREYFAKIKSYIEAPFEKVRSLNSEMRDEAERQLQVKLDEIYALNEEIKQLTDRLNQYK